MEALLTAMTSQQLSEWMAYFTLEPFGDEILDTHLATIAAILANANKAKGTKARKVEDFQLWKNAPKKPFDAEALFDNLRSWAIASGAKKE